MSYSIKLVEEVKTFLIQHEIKYSFDEKEGFFNTDFMLDDEETILDFGLAVLEDSIVSYTLIPQPVKKNAMAAVSEYLHRANYGLIFGNFELDWEEGLVQFKCFLPAPGEEIDPELISDLFESPLAIINRYYDGLMALQEDPSLKPAELIIKAEKA